MTTVIKFHNNLKRTFNRAKFDNKFRLWILSQEWKDISNQISTILFDSKIENIPYQPKYLVEKDGIKMFLYPFQKGDYPYSKKLGQRVTGLDWYKYQFAKAIQDITRIFVGVVMWSELSDLMVFRQLDMLGKPIIYFKGSSCLAKEYGRYLEAFKCYTCWKNNPQTVRDCIHHQKKKIREMAMWTIALFSNDTIIQRKIF